MSNHHAHTSSALIETVAGLSAGASATLAVHPLDVIKTRLQIYRSSHLETGSATSRSILRSLLAQPHPVATLYRGLTPNLLGNSASWALFFYFKALIETPLSSYRARTSSSHSPALTPADYFCTSLSAGLLVTFVTNPIWVLKTRMLSTDRGSVGAYPSMWAGAKEILHREGWRGFYKGLGVSCLGVSHGAVQFAAYEPLKRAWMSYSANVGPSGPNAIEDSNLSRAKLGNDATLAISSASKMFAGTVTYPYQVIRARLQTYDSELRFGKGIVGVSKKIWKEEGTRGFYRGLGPNIVRVLPATWVTFLVYENVRYYLPQMEL